MSAHHLHPIAPHHVQHHPALHPVHQAIRPRIASLLIGYTDHMFHLRARNYFPNLGTFLSLDPFEGTRSRPMSLNGYSYVEGNVPNWTDPSGLQTTQTNEGGNGNSDYYLYRVYGYLPGDGAALNSARYPRYGVSPANSTFPFRVEGLNGIPPARPPVYIPPSYEFSLWDVLQSRFFPSIPGIGNDWAAGWDTPSTPRELSLEIEQALYINSGAACTVDSVDPRYADATWVQQQLQGTQSQNPTPQPTPTATPDPCSEQEMDRRIGNSRVASEIVGTPDFYPNQSAVDRPFIIRFASDMCRNGFNAVHAIPYWQFADIKVLAQGHHRFVASYIARVRPIFRLEEDYGDIEAGPIKKEWSQVRIR
jgi:RHS repeat-associated protein